MKIPSIRKMKAYEFFFISFFFIDVDDDGGEAVDESVPKAAPVAVARGGAPQVGATASTPVVSEVSPPVSSATSSTQGKKNPEPHIMALFALVKGETSLSPISRASSKNKLTNSNKKMSDGRSRPSPIVVGSGKADGKESLISPNGTFVGKKSSFNKPASPVFRGSSPNRNTHHEDVDMTQDEVRMTLERLELCKNYRRAPCFKGKKGKDMPIPNGVSPVPFADVLDLLPNYDNAGATQQVLEKNSFI
jgi:hypothetical protein